MNLISNRSHITAVLANRGHELGQISPLSRDQPSGRGYRSLILAPGIVDSEMRDIRAAVAARQYAMIAPLEQDGSGILELSAQIINCVI